MIIHLKRRPFLSRLWRSYDGYRAILGRRDSLRAAWMIARA